MPTAELRRRCDPASLPFETTATLEDLPELPGQERALAALRFGVRMRGNDYNMFALGPIGLGKHAVVRAILDERAARDPVPDDWCYVHDFAERHAPRALRLPPGRAVELRDRLDALVPEARAALRAALESKELRGRTEALAGTVVHEHERAYDALKRDAAARGFALEQTDEGHSLVPIRDGKPMTKEAFRALPKEEQERIDRDMERIHDQVIDHLRRAAEWTREVRAKVRRIFKEVARDIVGQVLGELRRAFSTSAECVAFLAGIEEDLVAHADELVSPSEGHELEATRGDLPFLRRYRVNVITDPCRRSPRGSMACAS